MSINNNKRRCATLLAMAFLSASGMSIADQRDGNLDERKRYHESARHADVREHTHKHHEHIEKQPRTPVSQHSRHFTEDQIKVFDKNQRPSFKHTEKRKLERHEGDQFEAGIHRNARAAVMAREERQIIKKYLSKLPEEERQAMRKELKEMRKEVKRSGAKHKSDRRKSDRRQSETRDAT